MEDVQRQTQKDALLATARTIASTLPGNLYQDPFILSSHKNPERDSYAYSLTGPIILDGFDDDWELTPEHRRIFQPILKDGFQVSAVIGHDRNYLYLHVQVKDEKIVYPDKQNPVGDEVLVSTFDNKLLKNTYTVSTSAPGSVSVSISGENPEQKSLTGFWHETVDGYNVEMKLPREDVGIRFGFLVKDVDAHGEGGFILGSLIPTGTAFGDGINSLPGILRTRNPALEAELQQFVRPNLRLSVVADDHWEIAAVGGLINTSSTQPSGIMSRIYRMVLDRDDQISDARTRPGYIQGPDTQNALEGRGASNWAKLPKAGRALVSAVYPLKNDSVVIGALRLEQSSDDIMLLSNSDSVSFIDRSLLLTLSVALVLLGYASYLSVRVQNLRNAAEAAISTDGQLKGNFVASDASDEIGDLSRSFSTLLGRVQDYTDYLEGLAGRLSHELRTPLTIVRSSLDNLASEKLSVDAEKYANRAQDGVARLGQILTAMSEANRLEQSIQDRDIVGFDIVDLLQKNTAAFRDIYPDYNFELEHEIDEYDCQGAPELISQLLDKLVSNALDFTDARKQIGLILSANPDTYSVTVWNYGVELPDTMIGKLFDSMVSVRSKKGKAAHLGLGLHIAKMIAEFHQGTITASNLENDRGAKFVVTLARKGRP